MSKLADKLLDDYGPLLTTEDLAKVFKYKNARSVQESLNTGLFPDPEKPFSAIHKKGKRILANYQDVAIYIESNFGQITNSEYYKQST